jgi:protein phosphatase
VETVLEYLGASPWRDPADSLKAAFELANQAVFDITSEGRAATTLVVAVVSERDGAVTVANVGDSRAYLVADGHARQITQDHSLVAARVAAGHMTAAQARKAPDRNLLTRAVGSERAVQVDVFGPAKLESGQRLVLCTDGVYGMIEDEAIGRLAGGLAIEESAGALVAAALEAGGHDNATALVGGFAPSTDSARGGAGGRGRAAGLRRILPTLHMPRVGRRHTDTEAPDAGEHQP